MKAPAFAYARPRALAEAFELLARHGDAARILAGGQSLLAMLNLRLASPAILVDISGLEGMTGIAIADGQLRIGGLTRHRDIERSAQIALHCPLLTQAAPHIAHVAIRNAGTIGGSLALADPAAEWPACCLALDARLRLVSAEGERLVAAREFFKGLYSTDLRPGEILTEVMIPLLPGYRSSFLELARRRGDYAIAGLAALARSESGTLRDVRLAYLGAGATPVLAARAMKAAEGKPATPEVLEAVKQALEADLAPLADTENTPQTKLHLAKVLTGRALATLATLAALAA